MSSHESRVDALFQAIENDLNGSEGLAYPLREYLPILCGLNTNRQTLADRGATFRNGLFAELERVSDHLDPINERLRSIRQIQAQQVEYYYSTTPTVTQATQFKRDTMNTFRLSAMMLTFSMLLAELSGHLAQQYPHDNMPPLQLCTA